MTGRRLDGILRALADPRLEGARCAGMAPWFDVDELDDEDSTADRLAAAARVCGHCPVLPACRTAVAELGSTATGMWAGTAYGSPGRRGRPRKRTGRTK